MTPEELKAAQNMLHAYRGNRVLAVTITVEEWMKGTELGPLQYRSSEMKAIDQALRNYWTQSKTPAAFISLKTAFDNWIRSQERAGKAWTKSDRNRNGLISKLHEQIVLVEAGRSVTLMGDQKDWEARKAMVTAERQAIERLFKGRKLVFKTAEKDLFTQVTGGVNDIRSAATGLRDLKQAVTPSSVSDVAKNLCGGQDPGPLFSAMGTSFSAFCSSASAIIGAAKAPAMLLKDIVVLGMRVNTRCVVNRERYMFRPGNADEAINAIIRMIDREIALCGIDIGQQVASIVANAFQVGPIAELGNAVVSTLVTIKLYMMMVEEMKGGNNMLSAGNYTLDLFNASPVLGSYFIIMADTSVWVNYSVFDIGTPDWNLTVEAMVKRAEPVRDKARDLIKATKYALSGTEGFKGLEWEHSWRNNKVSYVLGQLNTEAVLGKVYDAGKGVVEKLKS